jgi:hypothetical protein
MIRVSVQCDDAHEGMELVRELRSAGLIQGQDFDFQYCPYNYDNFTGKNVYRHMVFSFHTEKYGTFYALKWS